MTEDSSLLKPIILGHKLLTVLLRFPQIPYEYHMCHHYLVHTITITKQAY